MAAEKKSPLKKATPFENFEKGVGRAKISPAYVVAGPEEMRRREAIRLIKERVEKTRGGLSLKEIICPQNPNELPNLSVADVIDHLRSNSLFGGGNIAVMRLADFFLSTADNLEHILNYLKRPAEASCLVVELTDGASSAAKKIGALSEAVDCRSLYDRPAPWQTGAAPSDSELTRWIVAQARDKFQKKISPEAAFELSEMSGSNLARLTNELEKISLFTGPEKTEIEAEDIERCTGHLRTHGLFSLLDAVSDKNAALALKTLQAMMDRGLALGADEPVTDEQGIAIILVSRLHRRLKQISSAKRLLETGAGEAGLMREFKFRMEFQARRLAEQAANFSAGDFPKCYEALLEADESLKSTSNPPSLILQRLLLRLCQ